MTPNKRRKLTNEILSNYATHVSIGIYIYIYMRACRYTQAVVDIAKGI